MALLFLLFIFISAFTVMNMLIGILCEASISHHFSTFTVRQVVNKVSETEKEEAWQSIFTLSSCTTHEVITIYRLYYTCQMVSIFIRSLGSFRTVCLGLMLALHISCLGRLRSGGWNAICKTSLSAMWEALGRKVERNLWRSSELRMQIKTSTSESRSLICCLRTSSFGRSWCHLVP